MNKNLVFSGIVVLLLGLCGCTRVDIEFGYQNDEHGFGFDPPEEWVYVENASEEVSVRFTPPSRDNVVLNISLPLKLSIGLALSVYADDIQEQYPEVVDNFSVVYRDWRDIEGLNAYEIICTYEENGVLFTEKQVAVAKSRKVFLITFMAMNTSYDEFIDVVDAGIDSFGII
jgi:hypothetical protein